MTVSTWPEIKNCRKTKYATDVIKQRCIEIIETQNIVTPAFSEFELETYALKDKLLNCVGYLRATRDLMWCHLAEVIKITEYQIVLDKTGVCKRASLNESAEHLDLKLIAKNAIEKIENIKLYTETTGQGADVYDKKHSLRIECGNADPDLVLTELFTFQRIKFYWVPYSTTKTSKIFSFTKSNNADLFQQEIDKELKSLVKKDEPKW